MVVEVSNPLNNYMHYGDVTHVTTLDAPDNLPTRIWYSDSEANTVYNQLETDIYDGMKKAKPKSRKFPLSLKILAGIVALGAAILYRKNILAVINKIFKKKSPTP